MFEWMGWKDRRDEWVRDEIVTDILVIVILVATILFFNQ